MAEWVATVQRTAYGPLQLSPEQLWASTPRELAARLRGYEWREERLRRTLAWMQANLLNVHLPRRKRIKPDDLLKRPKSAREKERKFAALWAKIERQRR